MTAAVSSDEVCFGDREKEEPPSPIEASPPRSFLEKVSKKKTPKTVKMPKPSKVPKPPKPPKPPKSLKLKDGSKKKGKKCRGSASPTIPNLDLLEAHTKEALTKIEPPKKGKVGGLDLPTYSQWACRHLRGAGLWTGAGPAVSLWWRPRAAGLCPSKLGVVGNWGETLMIKAAEFVLGQVVPSRVTWGDKPAESSLGPRHWLKPKGG